MTTNSRPPSKDASAATGEAPGFIGQTFRHFRITAAMGRGGMGVVYRAQDTRLQRTVALKFLSPDLTRDPAAKERLIREARAASSLEHPNVCTIYEIDETDDGRLFLAMPSYEGETLGQRIDRAPLGVNEALEFAVQIAQGLRKAHEAGIVHRDIKPSNLFLTTDTVVKILDFGLAKLTGQSDLTRTGVIVGTVAYMSPEQLKGAEADRRSDLWALGIVLHQMVHGTLPFRAKHDLALIQAILNDEPTPPGTSTGIPPGLASVLKKLLQKEPEARYQSAGELIDDLTRLRSPARESPSPPKLSRFGIAAALVMVLAAGIGAAAWMWSREAGIRWARDEAVPQVGRLVDAGSYLEAFEVAGRARVFVPDDPMLRTLTPQFAATFSLTTTPPEVEVSVRRYDTDAEWQHLGRTPLEGINLPRHPFRWKVEKEGYETAEFVTTGQQDRGQLGSPRLQYTLHKVGEIPPEMVFVREGNSPARFGGARKLAAFFIDRHEVTNQEFKQFVDAGGYSQKAHWEDLEFVKDGRNLSWEDAMALFVDSTRGHGPAGWELGDYPDGQDSHPVTGVSWFEAAAFARYRGKALPTIHHWAHAVQTEFEVSSPLAVSIIPLSNFGAMGPAPVGRYPGVGPRGTYDMYGNAREWVWNASPSGGMLLGGAWSDPGYAVYGPPPEVSKFDRSETNGFRLMKEATPGQADASLRGAVNLRAGRIDYGATRPATDAVFEGYREQFKYESRDPLPTEVSTLDTRDDWIKQRVTIDAGYDGERMNVFLFIPRRHKPKFVPLVYFPGLSAFAGPAVTSDGNEPLLPVMNLDFMVKSGRALVYPIYGGAYERRQEINRASPDFMRRVVGWRRELGRTLDYLESRQDIDTTRATFVGLSYGASFALPALAMEPRFKFAILLSGGFGDVRVFPTVEAIHYVPRIRIPVLMVKGAADSIVPLETNQRPLYELVGSADKRHKVLDAGHVYFPRKEFLDVTLPWMNSHLGEAP